MALELRTTPSTLISKSGDPSLCPEEIVGPRVLLLALTDIYAESIFAEFTEEIVTYMSPPASKSIDETLAFIARAKDERESSISFHFAVVDRATSEFLGVCGLHATPNKFEPELGLWIKKSAHGNRFGKEAIIILKEWAEKNLDVQSFIYPVARNNVASRKIAEFLGGHIFEEKIVPTLDGTRELDEVVYRIPIGAN